MIYRAQVPLRVDFGGGWTDVPLFAESETEGGAVLAAAIDRYASGRITRPSEVDERFSIMHRKRSALTYEVDAPVGAGLGASAAQTLLWLTLVKTTVANVSERRDLAESAWRIECELGIVGGKQDEYACAVGGLSFMTFGSETRVETLTPGFPFVEEFERRLVLVYTGRSRLSSDIHDQVWNAYRQGDRAVLNALRKLRALAYDLRDALMGHDLAAFGSLMNQNWEAQKVLAPGATTVHIDNLMALAARSGAVGGKACGAGGGCLLFLANDGAELLLAESLRRAGARHLPFQFDWYGVHLTKG